MQRVAFQRSGQGSHFPYNTGIPYPLLVGKVEGFLNLFPEVRVLRIAYLCKKNGWYSLASSSEACPHFWESGIYIVDYSRCLDLVGWPAKREAGFRLNVIPFSRLQWCTEDEECVVLKLKVARKERMKNLPAKVTGCANRCWWNGFETTVIEIET